ncbi:PspC domain-containing protein [Mumia sp.]|uniref:PspC domain-containing protein n=1 Tax=Mumia sp. TaxID=1965300 RepID=UPI0026190BE8|nr:PspC domain-containing protein [Mumia sp.]MDD9349226.1 PspC domain-containing protein [Mumia sp.]
MDDTTSRPEDPVTPPASLGTGSSTAPEGAARPPTTGSLTDIRRTESGRMVAGVCAGIGRTLGIDPVIPRILFAVFTLVGFGGVIAYVASWILIPDERTGESYLKRWLGLGDSEPQIRLVGLGAAGLIAVTWTWGWGWQIGPLWVAALVVIAWVGYREYQERRDSGTSSVTPPPNVPPPPAPSYAPPPWAPTAPAPVTPTPFAPTGAPSYAAVPPVPPGPPGPAWGSAPQPAPVKPPKRPNPRHDRGTLTVITLSAMLIVTGVTLVATQGDLAPSVYAAAATGTLALGMLIGTVFGNARPLILPAILAVMVLAVSTVIPRLDAGRIETVPTSAADLRSGYAVGTGEVVVDLRQVSDPAALDGRRLELEVGLGGVRVYVPATLDIDLDASVGAGSITALGYQRGGVQTSLDVRDDTSLPDLILSIDVSLGDVEVIRS